MSKRPHLAEDFGAEALNNSNKGGEQGGSETSQKKRKRSTDKVELSLQSLIPPQGKQLEESSKRKDRSRSSNEEKLDQLEVDWDAVIERAMSHPHEARECYFKQARSMSDMSIDSTEPGSNRLLLFSCGSLTALSNVHR